MKNMLGNLLLSALSTASSINWRPPPINPFNRRRTGVIRNRQGTRAITRVQQSNRRRRRWNKGSEGIEVNKAEGGFKSITIPYRTQGIGINTFARLMIVKIGDDWVYRLAPENENYAQYQSYNLTEMLNWSSEFTDRLKSSSQYLVQGVRISISNDRVPEAKDRLSKLLLSINTSKVQVQDARIQNNVMRLNMNQMGTKNFNFNINATNMNKDFVGWQEAESLYNGNIYLHLDAQDTNHINDETETSIILGTVKITFSILTRIQDYTKVREPTKKLTNEQKLEQLEKELHSMKIKEEENKTPSMNTKTEGNVTDMV
jgi:hypothetical protein